MSPVILPALAPPGTLAYYWVDAHGAVRNLSGNATGVNVLMGERGLGLPPIDLSEEKLPFGPGTLDRHVAVGSRMVELPLDFSAGSAVALEGLMDAMYRSFATADERSRTPGYLRVRRRDGSQRQLACYYVGGLEGDLSDDEAGEDWQSAIIALKAPDPWPSAIVDTVVAWAPADLPNVAVLNTGDLEAFPIWHITGPTAVNTTTITNTTTGESWKINAATATGLGIVIDTRPANLRPSIAAYRDLDGLNVYSSLTAASELWWMAPGQNNITITLAGTDATTRVSLTYRPRYRALLR